MPVVNLVSIPVYTWIPPSYYPLYKLTVTRLDGTIDDITDFVTSFDITDGVTEIIGTFSIIVANGNENYSNIWSGNEDIKFYADYETTATTLRFAGKVEKVSSGGSNIVLTGRSYALPFLGLNVTKSYSNIETSVILLDLISTYAPSGYTTTNIATTSTNLSVNWYQKPFWDCIVELCNTSGFECYVDYNKDFHYFASGSILNTTEAIVHDANLFETGEFASDYQQIKNRIVVYGSSPDGIPIIATAEDTALQASLGRIQEDVITDTNIITFAQAQQRASDELSLKKTPPIIGDLTSMGLPTLKPGDKIRISDPINSISPNYYKATKFKHFIKNAGEVMKTTVTIEKFGVDIPDLFKSQLDVAQRLSDNPNPYEMRYSYNITFDDGSDSESFTNTSLNQGQLKMMTGLASGTWVSNTRIATSDITSFQFKVVGSNLNGAVYGVSIDNGQTYTTVTKDQFVTVAIPNTLTIKIRIVFSDETTIIDGVAVLYK